MGSKQLFVVFLLTVFVGTYAQQQRVCLLNSQGGNASFSSWWDQAQQGLTKATNDFKVAGSVINPPTGSSLVDSLDLAMAQDCDLVIALGDEWVDPLVSGYADAHANRTFAVIGSGPIRNSPFNLIGIYYAENQAAFLAGVVGGLFSDSGVLGLIAGPETDPIISRYIEGFTNGALFVCECCKMTVLTVTSLNDANEGQTLAKQLLDGDADVIFAAAGATGAAAMKQAVTPAGTSSTTSKTAYVVGYEEDAYNTVFGAGSQTGSAKVITSAIKKLDVTVYNIVGSFITRSYGDFQVGTLQSGDLGIAPPHQSLAQFTADMNVVIDGIGALLSGDTTAKTSLYKYRVNYAGTC